MNKFEKDLEIGKNVESLINEKIIKRKYPSAYLVEGKNKNGDIFIPEKNMFIEIKSDRKSNYTGNFVVEVFMNEPSGLSTTKSAFWIFSDGEKLFFISVEKIWEAISKSKSTLAKFVGNGDTSPKFAFLIKKEHIQKYAESEIDFFIPIDEEQQQ